MNAPGGWITEENPNAKMTPFVPALPEQAWQEFMELVGMFDEMGGFPPVMQGRGEQGVRANIHAQAMTRNASGRMRDKALVVERSLEEVGDLAFKILQAKDATVFKDDKGTEFLLAQVPADYQVKVDSHSGSPAFSEDHKELAFALAKSGAIGPEDLIMLTQPPMLDILIAHAKERAKAQAEFAAKHLEEAAKPKKK
jgi:hypothetical protein